jgi:hypothetical protein
MKAGLFLAAALFATCASADWQNGYTKKDGSYVQGHQKSEPDQYRFNNYGSQSNGGHQRDEFSSGGGATNRSNSSWGSRDNDRDGIPNAYDSHPNSKKNCSFGYSC